MMFKSTDKWLSVYMCVNKKTLILNMSLRKWLRGDSVDLNNRW